MPRNHLIPIHPIRPAFLGSPPRRGALQVTVDLFDNSHRLNHRLVGRDGLVRAVDGGRERVAQIRRGIGARRLGGIAGCNGGGFGRAGHVEDKTKALQEKPTDPTTAVELAEATLAQVKAGARPGQPRISARPACRVTMRGRTEQRRSRQGDLADVARQRAGFIEIASWVLGLSLLAFVSAALAHRWLGRDDAIDAKRDAAMGRAAVAQGREQEAEFLLRFL